MSAIAAIHVGLKQLGIVEEDARDLYERQTGKRSLREMQPRELEAVVGELRRLGFRPLSKGAAKRIDGRYTKKLQAMWIACWNLGLVENRTDQALIAFVRRQTKIDHTRFLHHPQDAAKVIEALKGWMARKAGVNWGIEKHIPAFARLPGFKIARAQFALLKVTVPEFAEFNSLHHWMVMNRHERGDVPCEPMRCDASHWQVIMNQLGERVRAARRQSSNP